MATPERTHSETIYQACIDLRNAQRQISRRILVQVTGLKMKIVDDHVTRLEEQHGKLRRLAGGYVEVVEQFPANRKFNKAIMRDGMIEITLGGDTIEMTPAEAAMVGVNLLGEATLYSQLRGDRDVSDRVARLERENKVHKERQADLVKELARLRQQPQLAFDV